MKNHPTAKIRSVDELLDGLVITFSDGRFALFPAGFLYSNIEAVGELFESEVSEPGHLTGDNPTGRGPFGGLHLSHE